MRWLFLWLLFVTTIGFPPANADDNVVREFSGSGTVTTGFFKVPDRWEVRWNARQVVSVAVMSSDGTIVAGAAGVLRGSLFMPLGGRYYFKITDGAVAPPAGTHPLPPDSIDLSPISATTADAAPFGVRTRPGASTNAPPAHPPHAPGDTSSPPAPEQEISWHLQVVQLAMSVGSDQALTVYTPYFMVPDAAVTPVAPPPEPPPPVLTNDQIHAMVTIKGDRADGAGFLVHTPDGTFVVTHLHLLAANPNIKLITNAGAPLTMLALRGATDRDLAMLTVQDKSLVCLPLPADVANNVAAGDELIIPDIGLHTDVMLGKAGKIIGTGPDRLDFDNALDWGTSGAPVIHVKSGNVLAIATVEKKPDVSDDIAKAWRANPAPGAANIFPYYGLRLSGVQAWETFDEPRFLQETLLLKQFHHDTRCLDSYLNGRGRHDHGDDENGAPDNRYFLKNIKLRGASDTYKQLSNGADRNQQLEAARELLFDLEGVADTGVAALQQMNSPYSYDQTWAREEIAYRQALKKELDDLSFNIGRLDNLARSR